MATNKIRWKSAVEKSRMKIQIPLKVMERYKKRNKHYRSADTQ